MGSHRSATVVATLIALLSAAVVASAAAPARSPATAAIKCARGFVHAVVAGKHRCVKRGQRCTRRWDRQYHRYKFHCHGARLTGGPPIHSSPPPPPSTSPPPPPSQTGADLEVEFLATPERVPLAQPITWTVAVINYGPLAANDVVLTFAAPGVAWTSITEVVPLGVPASLTSCDTPPSPQPVRCRFRAIAGGFGTAMRFVGRAAASGQLVATATVTSSTTDPVSANNTESRTIIVE